MDKIILLYIVLKIMELTLHYFSDVNEKTITTTNLNAEEPYLKVKNFLDEQCLSMIFKN